MKTCKDFPLVQRAIAAVAIVLLTASGGYAEDDAALAKQSQNPVANLISVPIQSNVNFGVGPGYDVQYLNLIQPVIPMGLTENFNWINRVILPVPFYQPSLGPGVKGRWGLGDIQYEGFLSPSKPGPLIWGIGPYINFPTATDDVFGSGKWSAGPAVVLLTMPGNWVLGAIVTQLWSFAGDGDRADVNLTGFQYFINYNIPKSGGWYLTSTPPGNTYNWNTASENEWTIPVGGGIGKVFKIGKQPINAKLQGIYFAKSPTGGPNWGVQLQVTLLFPQ